MTIQNWKLEKRAHARGTGGHSCSLATARHTSEINILGECPQLERNTLEISWFAQRIVVERGASPSCAVLQVVAQ